MSAEEEQIASVVNREPTALVVAAGQRMGFGVTTEYVVPRPRVTTEYGFPRGRSDVVWSWTPPPKVTGLHDAFPVGR